MCNQRLSRLGLVAAAAFLSLGLTGANAQCFINNQGQMVCPSRPTLYGITRPLQQRVQVTPQMTRYVISAPRSASYGSTGGYQSVRSAGCNCINCQCGVSNVKDITEQRAAELKELKGLKAENKVLRATNAQLEARRAPQEPGGFKLPLSDVSITIPKDADVWRTLPMGDVYPRLVVATQ